MDQWLQADFWHKLLEKGTDWILGSAPTLLVILVLAFVLWRSLRFAHSRFVAIMRRRGAGEDEPPEELEKRIQTLSGIVFTTARLLLIAVVATLVLRELGVDIAPLIAGAGVAGLAVGFGAQNLVRDIISGFFMIVDNQIRTGDVVVINGTAGMVESLNPRRTILRDLEGVVHIFPNGSIATLSNRTKGWSAAVFDIGVAYKEDTDRVATVMSAVSAEMAQDPDFAAKILEPMEILGVDAFADSAVVVKARWKTRPGAQYAVAREYRRRLKIAFAAQGIEIPFPHQSLYFGEASKPIEVRLHKE